MSDVHPIVQSYQEQLQAAQKQVRFLEKQLQTSLANNLCPDHRDKQYGKPCLACTIETLERKLSRATSLPHLQG